MFASDIALLVGGPILTAILLFEANREHKIQIQRRGLFRFPLALLLSTVACLGTALLYAQVNPYVIYSYPNAVFFSLFALGFIILYAVLAGSAKLRPTPHQTTAVLGEMFLLWWIILAVDIERGLLVVRAFFFAPFLFMSSLIGLAAMLLQAIRGHASLPGDVRLPDGLGSSTESDSLVSKLRTRLSPHKLWRAWNPNLRHVTIVGITLVTQLGFFIDLMVMGNSWIRFQQPRSVLLVDATSALFLVLPFATFMHKLHWTIPSTFSLVFIGTFFFSLFIFPFTSRAPAYLEFAQRFSLDNGTNTVVLTGPRGYLEYDIVPHLPSFKASTDLHVCGEAPLGLVGQPESSYCKWHGLPPPEAPEDLLMIQKLPTISTNAIKVLVIYSPSCRGFGLEFIGPQPRWEGISRSEEASGRVIETFKVWIDGDKPVYKAKASCVWNINLKHVTALTEAEAFSPRWARVRGDSRALVIAESITEI